MLPLLPSPTRFPKPDWPAIAAQLEGREHSIAELNAFWCERGRSWVALLRDALGKDYRGYESANFWLISSQPEATCRRLITWAEETRKKVNQLLDDTAGHGKLYGKIPILVVHSRDLYYDYFAGYLADGEYGATGGVYLNDGYGHFLFDYEHLSQAEAVLAHELTHALVSHLPLPAWVNEGVAQLCEIWSTRRDNTRYDEIKETLGSFWTVETIQEFWTGRGFFRPDEGQMHNYHLALVLTRKLTPDLPRFRAFLRDVNANDAGNAALREHYDITPGQLVAEYLGEGEWEPLNQTNRAAPTARISDS